MLGKIGLPTYLFSSLINNSQVVHSAANGVNKVLEDLRISLSFLSLPDHVEILLENVVEGQDFNFKKMDSGEVNSLREPYDYSSIMHYAKGTFAKANKDETIRPKACCPRPPIGQRIQLSPGDVRQTNKLYGCPCKLHHEKNVSKRLMF